LYSNYRITVSKKKLLDDKHTIFYVQCAMATETALSELSAGSRPTSSTPPMQSTSHLKNMLFFCSTLYKPEFITEIYALKPRFLLPTQK